MKRTSILGFVLLALATGGLAWAQTLFYDPVVRSFQCWAIGLALLLLLVPASASALTEATSSVDLICAGGQPPTVTVNEAGPRPLSESCETSVDFGASGSRSSSAAGTSTFGASPTTSATADSGVTGIPGGGADSFATTQVRYQLEVIEIAAPPVGGVTEVPVVLSAAGAVTGDVISSPAFTNGEASVSLVGPGVNVLEGASDGSPSFPQSSFDVDIAIPNIEIGSAYTLAVRAQCRATASSPFSVPDMVNAHCQSDTDLGSVTFDQAAFDALMGGSTFPLADHYAFDVSPNLMVEVPALGREALLLLVLGIAALGIVTTSRAQEFRTTCSS
ncbi:MAG: hypothetical protein JRG89_12525 [Deltaproteobacteria bacterium]|nr:hypothetical protein [Deltaproteobacteria bacterium]